MLQDKFGYDERLPENIQNIFMWLCQDVSSLQSKWDFYLDLYGKDETTDLISDLASWSFNIIEESLRNAMIMAICRLSDPSKSLGKENLSLATLVEKCSDISGLDTILANFQAACDPISKYRNKLVGHNDLNTRIKPRENPLPGIGKSQINLILKLATDILKNVIQHFSNTDLNFHIVAQGGADELVFWLKAGKEHHSRV